MGSGGLVRTPPWPRCTTYKGGHVRPVHVLIPYNGLASTRHRPVAVNYNCPDAWVLHMFLPPLPCPTLAADTATRPQAQRRQRITQCTPSHRPSFPYNYSILSLPLLDTQALPAVGRRLASATPTPSSTAPALAVLLGLAVEGCAVVQPLLIHDALDLAQLPVQLLVALLGLNHGTLWSESICRKYTSGYVQQGVCVYVTTRVRISR